MLYKILTQGGHQPGKPGKVSEFGSGQGKSEKSQGECVLAFGVPVVTLFNDY